MEKRLNDAGYVKREDYFDNECCHCAHKKKIDEDTRYCTKLNIYVGANDVCNYFYDYYKTDKARLQINQLARAFSRKG
ncbi:MAG TPA: hypothetical protein DCZ40_10085 [Lachnospiraceae bacterium]|nr:hypothetical protein [Lachnospiraceae bacterium]